MTISRDIIPEIFHALVGWILAMDIDRDVNSPNAWNVRSRREVFCPFDLGGRSQIKNRGDPQVADLLHAVCSCSTWIGTSEDEAAPY